MKKREPGTPEGAPENLPSGAEAGAPEMEGPEALAGAADSGPLLSQEQMLELVAEGQRLLGQGRAEEALERAESTLASDPLFLAGLALKGDALEKLGDISGALAAYETILEIKPDSAMDRIRATHLRRHASLMDLEVEEAPTKTRAILAAAAAATLFLVVTVSALMLSQRPPSVEVAQRTEEPSYSTFPSIPPVPTGPETQQPASPAPLEARPDQPTGQPGYVAPPRASSGSRAIVTSPASGEEVAPVNPLPNGMPSVSVRPSGTQQPAPSGPTASVPAGGPPPVAGGSGAGPTPDEPASFVANNRRPAGVVDIRPSDSNPPERRSNGGTAPIQDEDDARQSATALVQVARDAFIRGDYSRAADAYERALRMGASRGSTNQRLAQCYERMGRKSDAISAYEKAIAAYQSQLAGGDDNPRVSAALEASRQALKVLRGS